MKDAVGHHGILEEYRANIKICQTKIVCLFCQTIVIAYSSILQLLSERSSPSLQLVTQKSSIVYSFEIYESH